MVDKFKQKTDDYLKMNKLQNLFDLVSKEDLVHDFAPTDLFLAGIIAGSLQQCDTSKVKQVSEKTL